MISKHDDIPCTIVPQSNPRCSVISAITMPEDDFMSRREASRGDNDHDDDDDDDIDADIEQMVMAMYNRNSAAALSGIVSEGTESDEATSGQHDRFGSFMGPRTTELRHAMPKPERKPSVTILLSSATSSSHDGQHHDIQFNRGDSLPAHHGHHQQETFDRIPNLPSRRPSESISHMQSHASELAEGTIYQDGTS